MGDRSRRGREARQTIVIGEEESGLERDSCKPGNRLHSLRVRSEIGTKMESDMDRTETRRGRLRDFQKGSQDAK